MDRRAFIRWLLGGLFLPFFPLFVETVEGEGGPAAWPKGSIGQFFSGEELEYEIGAWVFDRVAVGRLSFRKTDVPGRFESTLQGETVGILGWAAKYRVDTYRSTMEEVEGGRRLRSVSFEENVKFGNRLRRRSHFFNYLERKWTQLRQRKDGSILRKEGEIPPAAVYDDFLTASYNFRYGVYGGIERGRIYTVPTFPQKGSSSYEVHVASKEEEDRRKKSEKSKDGKEYFVKLFLDPEITHSKEGVIEGWLSKELYPMEGMIRDVLLFGDVRGRLVKKHRA